MNTTELKNVTVTITMDEYERLVNNKALADLNDDDRAVLNLNDDLCSEIFHLQSENIEYQDRIEDEYIPYIKRFKHENKELQDTINKNEKKYDLVLLDHIKMKKKIETLKTKNDVLNNKLEQIKQLV